MKLVVGLTGATGAPVAIRVLEQLRAAGVEIHLIVSQWAKTNIGIECDETLDYVSSLADEVYDNRNLAARVSSGSFRHDGMIIVPCSTKTLACIRMGFSDSLITRAADVSMKERRKLVLAVRESPFNSIHLENMLFLSNQGCTIFPLMPAYYNRPQSIDEMNRYMALRILDQFGIEANDHRRWNPESRA